MKNYLLFFMALMMSAISCQQSELIEAPLVDEQLNIEDRARKTTEERLGILRNGNNSNFYIQNNVWNQYAPGTGGQQAWLENRHSWGVKNDHYNGNGDVKSFPSIVTGKHYGNSSSKTRGLPLKVNKLGSIRCKWNQTNNFVRGNATMELWFNKTKNPSGESDISIMVWTQRKGMHPLGTKRGSMWANGKKYDVYKGSNGSAKVHSFVQVNNNGKFNGNIKPFINYCTANNRKWLPRDYFLISIQAGWEIIQGKPINANNGYTCFGKTTRYELGNIQ